MVVKLLSVLLKRCCATRPVGPKGVNCFNLSNENGFVMTPKRIWLINQDASTPETGYAGRTYYLGRELARLGHDVHVVSASYCHHLSSFEQIKKKYDTQSVEGLQFTRVKTPKYSRASSPMRVVSWLLFAWRLRGLSRHIKSTPDVILISSPPIIAYLGAEYLANKFGARLVFEVRDIWPLTLTEVGSYSKQHPFVRFMQWIEDRAYRRSEKVVSNLRDSSEHMKSRGLDIEKFHWIPNGYLQDEVANSEPLDESVLAQLPGNKFVVGYAGAIGRANALNILVEAARFCQDDPEIAFVIVGQGEEREAIAQDIKQKGLTNVTLIDRIPKRQIQSMLALFDACYIGLKKDPLFRFGVSPNKLFDYLYAAKPVIYGIDSGDYRPIRDAMAGVEVTPEDPVELAKAVKKLASSDPKERQIMGSNARIFARENYEYGVLAKKLEGCVLID